MSFATITQSYLKLCKVKVVLLMVFSAMVGMLLCYNTGFPWMQGILGLVGISLVASAGGAFNHIIDRKRDMHMSRTQHRPLVSGNISVRHATLFACILLIGGSGILWCYTNPLTTYLTIAAMCGYAFIYSTLLKPHTPQNIVIGGITGAIPPLLGWTSITGSIDTMPIILVMIIYLWTPPHFWALAIAKKADYAQANVPMLPVTHGIVFTKMQIILYSILTVLCTYLPVALQTTNHIYMVGVTLVNIILLHMAIRLYRDRSHQLAMPLFHYSITYLIILFACILLDHFLPI